MTNTNNTLWHYIDPRQQKIGPVSSDVIREAYRRGELRPDTLVWNAELPQWQSLASHAAALGIDFSQANHPMLNGRKIVYANFFHRWAAHMMDQWLVSAVAIVIIGIPAAAIYSGTDISFEKNPESGSVFLVATIFCYMLVYMCISGIYHVRFETSPRNGSFGKRYLGLEVKTETGEALDTRMAVLRWFSVALSHLSQSVGFLIAAFTPKRQALHDFVAHTLVLERDQGADTAPLDRNKRAIIILILGIVVMPIAITSAIMVPMFYFIEQQQQASLEQPRKIAALVVPVQQAIVKAYAVNQTCLTHDNIQIKPLLLPLKQMASDIYIGFGESGETCEIYLTWDQYKTLDYHYSGAGDWSCAASHTPELFGENCQILDY